MRISEVYQTVGSEEFLPWGVAELYCKTFAIKCRCVSHLSDTHLLDPNVCFRTAG